MTVIGVIPARWGSTRFPGKSLTPICGKPLIQWVVESALRVASLDEVLVATDDDRIFAAAEDSGVGCVMTRADHPSGTDRVAEAVEGRNADVVVNIQGDEPLFDPILIDRLVEAIKSGGAEMATAATPITQSAQLDDPGVVKVVKNQEGIALYFSRSLIPHVRDGDASAMDGLHWRHLGVYAYSEPFLQRLVATPPCATEMAEKLEQLRALHIGGRIAVLETSDEGIGVDTPADVKYVERVISERQG
ncbi:MAG: 3-deoxy-manno-octulosonate cytidylyltransferase [Kiritimatiellia bacterium]|jgi:3-deoxy-manno-octulosonate cytidylyltransferase (CMP-KDO synthetase)|nr:3-deoxy-manno-octulosonate cytidylyltransferase [Kiritimatiellia bacterium]